MPRATRRKYRKPIKTRRVKKKKRVVKRKRRVKSKKRIAKSKRRVKLINKTIKRVQAKLADEVVVMRRMHMIDRPKGQAQENDVQELDIRHSIVDGQMVLNQYVGYPVKYSDWWNINAFHGECIPRFYRQGGLLTSENDPEWEPKHPWLNYSDLYLQSTTGFTPGANSNYSQVDPRAYVQREIPFLPCVPKFIEFSAGPTWVNTNIQDASRLNKFARKGQRIKVRSNYMRFNFFVADEFNDMNVKFNSGHKQFRTDPVVGGADPNTVTYSEPNSIKEWSVAGKKYAKARIIVVKRNSPDDDPINLNDFLKDNNPYSMGTEEYRMKNYFRRKYKNDNDIIVQPSQHMLSKTETPNEGINNIGKLSYKVTNLKDLAEGAQAEKHNVGIMYDKIHNLRVGTSTTVKLSLMKGTVLQYADSPQFQENYTTSIPPIPPVSTSMVNIETAGAELGVTHNDAMPVSTNDLLRDMQAEQIAPPEVAAINRGRKNEYVPIGTKYAAFLLLMNQRCSTEYQIFQKFEFDN